MSRQPLVGPAARLSVSTIVGVLSGLLAGFVVRPDFGVLVGILVTAALFSFLGAVTLWPLDPSRTKQVARREDFRPLVDELIVAASMIGSLAGIVLLLVMGGSRAGPVAAAVALAGVFATWTALHLMYVTRYAWQYYDDTVGGIEFPSTPDPAYRDFFYFSFTVGMTFGVTDTPVTDPAIRAIVLRHAVVSFVFGAAIVATAINLVVGAFGG